MNISNRECLNYAVRCYLIDQTKQSISVNESQTVMFDYIANELTYEQVLNLAFNKNHNTEYISSDVLEETALFFMMNELGIVYEEIQIPETMTEKYEMLDKVLHEAGALKTADKAIRKYGSKMKWKGRVKQLTGGHNQMTNSDPNKRFSGMIKAKVGQAQTGIGKALQKHGGKGVAAAAGVAAAGVLGYYVYKKFFSKAKSQGQDPKQASKMAATKAIAALRTASSKSKDPKSKVKYAKEIAKMQKKAKG